MAGNTTTDNGRAKWGPAKQIRECFGISVAQLPRCVNEQLIRRFCLKRRGQTRGIELHDLGDIGAVIKRGTQKDRFRRTTYTVYVRALPLQEHLILYHTMLEGVENGMKPT